MVFLGSVFILLDYFLTGVLFLQRGEFLMRVGVSLKGSFGILRLGGGSFWSRRASVLIRKYLRRILMRT